MKVLVSQILNVKSKIIIDTNDFSFKLIEKTSDTIIDLPDAGFFDYLNEELVIFVSFDDNVYIYYNNHFHFFDKKIIVEYKVFDNMSMLYFKNNDSHKIIYSHENIKKVSSLYYTEEEEDANFGLWLFNVLNNSERLKIIKHYSPQSSKEN